MRRRGAGESRRGARGIWIVSDNSILGRDWDLEEI